MRKILGLFLFLLFFSLNVHALGSYEGRLYYLPMSVANNPNVMVELSEAKSVSKSDISSLEEQANAENSHLVAFRLRDNIMKNSGRTTFNNMDSFNVSLSSEDNWEFVHENNPTKRIPFTISVYCKEKQYSSGGEYGSFSTSDVLSVTTNQQSSVTLPISGVSTTATLSGNTMTFSIPTTTVSNSETFLGFVTYPYPIYIRDYFFCINIPEHAITESGYYSTTINLSSDSFYEVAIAEKSFFGFTYYELEKESSTKTIQDSITSITIRGYIGKEPGTTSGTYSFMVSNTNHTYSMDLGIEDSNVSYDVAKIYFYNTRLDTQSSSYVTNKSRFTDYKIYISPDNTLNSSEDYKFRLIGSSGYAESDENTIYYDLYISPDGSSIVSLDDCASSHNYLNNNYSNYSSNASSYYKVCRLGGVEKVNNCYILYPFYSYTKMSSNNDYQLTWTTDTTLYIKLKSRSTSTATTHLNGMYTSTLYFTVESP